MRISIRLSRNTRLSMGPVGWLLFGIFVVPVWLVIVLPFKVIAAIATASANRPAAPHKTAKPRNLPERLGREAEAKAAKRAQADALRMRRRGEREAKTAERRAHKQAHATQRRASHQAKVSARREHRAAIKSERGSRRWPEWTVIGACAGFVAGVALVGVAGNHTDSVVAEVGAALFSASIVSFAVAGPITLYRWYRARQGVAAAFAAGLQYKARHGTPPDQQ